MSDLCAVQSRNAVVPSESLASEEVTRAVKALFHSMWKHGGTRFMGANPISIERRNLPSLVDDYLVSLKSDGVRYMLVLLTVNDQPCAVMVDRKMKMYEVEVWGDADYYKGTVFDGELVWEYGFESPRLTLLLFDCVLTMGESMRGVLYSDRLLHIHGICLTNHDENDEETVEEMLEDQKKIACMNNLIPIRLEPKRFVNMKNTLLLWESRLVCSHKTDGLILAKNTDQIDTGKARNTFKWKPDNTIDIRITATCGDDIRAFVNNNGKSVPIESLSPDFQVVVDVNDLILCSLTPSLNDIFECSCTIGRSVVHFFPTKRRSDKPSPNDVNIVLATLRNVKENITIEEILDLVK
jgi:hypothetical protein